jgi:hypothetical protein
MGVPEHSMSGPAARVTALAVCALAVTIYGTEDTSASWPHPSARSGAPPENLLAFAFT